MEIKKGIGVSPGVTIARAVVLDAEEYRIALKTVSVDDIPAELERLRTGFDASLDRAPQPSRGHGPPVGARYRGHFRLSTTGSSARTASSSRSPR